MAFGNAVVGGGGELVRETIHSRNYVPGVSGWTINRDGTAEFSGVTVRGDLFIGNPPSPPNPYIHGTVMAGVPTIAVYDGVHTNPARIQGFDLGGGGGLVLDSGDPAGEDTSLAMGGNFGELFYEDAVNGITGLVHVGNPLNEMVKLRATGNGAADLEFGLDLTAGTPDGTGGVHYTVGELIVGIDAADDNYPTRVVDGKVVAAQTVTAVNVASDVNIGGANAQNVYLEADWCYSATITIDQRSSNSGNRLDYKLWGGNVGTTQLGGNARKFVTNTGANFDQITLVFVWRQPVTTTYTNVNLSANRAVGATNCDVATNAAYVMVIRKEGDAGKVQGL
jgi:hypothetical protein